MQISVNLLICEILGHFLSLSMFIVVGSCFHKRLKWCKAQQGEFSSSIALHSAASYFNITAKYLCYHRPNTHTISSSIGTNHLHLCCSGSQRFLP